MTISTTTCVISHNGDGQKTVFNFNFLIPEGAMRVYLTENGVATIVPPEEYGVIGFDKNEGGSVTFNVAPSASQIVTIRRYLNPTQTEDLVPDMSEYIEAVTACTEKVEGTVSAYANKVEDVLDRHAMVMQQLQYDMGRSVKAPVGSALDPENIINTIEQAAEDAAASKDAALNAEEEAEKAKVEAAAAKDAAIVAKDAALTAKDEAVAAKTAAETAAGDADAAKAAAQTAEQNAKNAATSASSSETAAVEAKDAAIAAKDTAVEAKTAAELAEKNAGESASAAAASVQASEAAKDAAVDAKDAAVTAKDEAEAAKGAAETAAQAASDAKGVAETAAANAKTSEDNAAKSASDVAKIADELGDVTTSGGLVPAGAVMPFAMASAPTGWLECNGAAVSRETYAALYAAIGNTYGSGDGSSTFNLPDLRGEFIRGFDHGRGVDGGRTVGTAQPQSYQSHNHTATTSSSQQSLRLPLYGTEGGNDFGLTGGSDSWQTRYKTLSSSVGHTHEVVIATSGSSETRPRNVAMMYCIKAA